MIETLNNNYRGLRENAAFLKVAESTLEKEKEFLHMEAFLGTMLETIGQL